MTFDKILDDGRLWAVRYDGDNDNALQNVFNQWNDPEWLWGFFTENLSDLESYFKITDVDQAIFDTMEDSSELECLILDISPDANLDKMFRPLENNRCGNDPWKRKSKITKPIGTCVVAPSLCH